MYESIKRIKAYFFYFILSTTTRPNIAYLVSREYLIAPLIQNGRIYINFVLPDSLGKPCAPSKLAMFSKSSSKLNHQADFDYFS